MKRLVNLDLLRSLCMLAVVVCHCSPYLGILNGINADLIVSITGILCDPIFFALSGYFAIRPLKSSLLSYYSRKISTVVLPLFAYSVVLFLYKTNNSNWSVAEYLLFFSNELGPWWFIPTLIPFLVVAPFLYWQFEKLDNYQIKTIAKAACLVTLLGVCLNYLCWLFRVTNHSTLELTINITKRLLPTVLIPGSGYFMYFCLGYFYRRLAPDTSRTTKKKLIAFGLVLWAFDVVSAYFGVDRFDPSYPWLFATIAILFLFDGLQVNNNFFRKVIEWTARRSYAIYLLQYTSIAMIAPFLYETMLHGSIELLTIPIRVLIWVVLVICSYFASLAIASLLDITLIRIIQHVYQQAVKCINVRSIT
ncbi:MULTISPECIES: acyltransferase [Bacteria]|uniref:acyltransferase n=1 Tax=Bacteria TaxID=2 RepID=UPI00097D8696|nr:MULTISPECIES: acyltransferase [Bacteria]